MRLLQLERFFQELSKHYMCFTFSLTFIYLNQLLYKCVCFLIVLVHREGKRRKRKNRAAKKEILHSDWHKRIPFTFAIPSPFTSPWLNQGLIHISSTQTKSVSSNSRLYQCLPADHFSFLITHSSSHRLVKMLHWPICRVGNSNWLISCEVRFLKITWF